MKKGSKIIIAIIFIVLLVIIAGGGYFFIKKINESNKKIEELENKIANSENINNSNTIIENSNSNNKTIVVEKEEISFEIPEKWKDTYKIKETTKELEKGYEISNIVNGKEVKSFSISINSIYNFGNSSWGTLGIYNDKKVYLMQNFICRSDDGENYNDNDYIHEKEVTEVLKTIKIKDVKCDYLTLSTDEIQFKIPKSWDKNAFLLDAQLDDSLKMSNIEKQYVMKINNDNKLSSTKENIVDVFDVIITSDDTYLNSSWKPIGKYNGKNVLVMNNFVCRDIDGVQYSQADYDLEKEVVSVINSINIK